MNTVKVRPERTSATTAARKDAIPQVQDFLSDMLKRTPLPQEDYLEPYKRGLLTLLELAKITMDGAMRLRSMQISAAKEAREKNLNAAKTIDSAHRLNDLFEAQAALNEAVVSSTLRYWSNYFEIVGAAQAEIMKQLTKCAGKETG